MTTDGTSNPVQVRYDYFLRPITIAAETPVGPLIAEVTPQSLPGKPVGQRQMLTVKGSGFSATSTLLFHDGTSSIPSSAEHLTFVSVNELKYNIAAGPNSAVWTVKVMNGTAQSNAGTFAVTAAAAQLLGLTISGPISINEGTNANFTAIASYSDGTTPRVSATWSVNGTAASINAATGALTAGAVEADQSVSVLASFGGKPASVAVTIVNVGGTGTATQELIVNGNFANGAERWLLSGNFQADARFSSALSSPGYAYLALADGAPGNNLAGTLDQVVTIPASASRVTLSYWSRVTSQEDGSSGVDLLAVRVLSPPGDVVFQIVDVRSNVNASLNYEQRTADLTSMKGQTIRLSFSAATNSSKPTTFRIDDVSLSAVLSTSTPPAGSGTIEVTGGGEVIANGSTTIGLGNNTYFSDHWMGETTALFNFRIYNRGNGTLALTGSPVVAIEGSQSFTVEAQPAADVTPGTYRSFQIRFDPKSVGAHRATVVIRSNDVAKPEYRFAIGGDGRFRDLTVPSVAISSPTVNPTHAASSATLSLAGQAADNVGVTQVTWSNSRGGGGTAVGTKAWTIVDLALRSGDNVLTIAARDAAGNVSTTNLTVTYTPTEPELTASVASLSQSVQQGANAASQAFTIRNSGRSTLTYTVAASSTGNWLSVTPASGTSTGEADVVTVNYASASLGAGTYQGTITVTATGAANAPLSIPVTLLSTVVSPTAPYVARSAAGTGIVNNGKVAAPAPDGGLLIAGEFSGGISIGAQSLTAAGSTDIFLARMDGGGQLVWLKRLGGINEESIDACVPHPAGGWVIAGTFRGVSPLGIPELTSAGNRDAFMARLDADGNVTWSQRAGGTGIDYGRQAAVDAQGNCFLVGSFTTSANFSGTSATVSAVGTPFDTFVAKYSASGAFQWARSVGGSQYDAVSCATADASGNLYVGGTFEQQATFGAHTLTVQGVSGADAYLAKFNANGDVVWAKRIGEPAGGFSIDAVNFVTPGPDGTCFFGGSSYGPVSIDGQNLPAQTGQMGFVGKVSAAGAVVWLRELAPSESNPVSFAEKGVVLGDGGIVVGGRMRGQLVFGGSTIPAETGSLTLNIYFAKMVLHGTGWIAAREK